LAVRLSNHVTANVCAYLQHYKPPDEKPSEYQTIPLSKIEDFGVHANSYYSLDISYFKSSLDAGLLDQLWGKYWVNTLASSPLLATRDLTAGQMRDIGETPCHFPSASIDLLDHASHHEMSAAAGPLWGKYRGVLAPLGNARPCCWADA
jgi:hypothetical protein